MEYCNVFSAGNHAYLILYTVGDASITIVNHLIMEDNSEVVGIESSASTSESMQDVLQLSNRSYSAGDKLKSHPISVDILCGAEDTKMVSSINCLQEDLSSIKVIFF